MDWEFRKIHPAPPETLGSIVLNHEWQFVPWKTWRRIRGGPRSKEGGVWYNPKGGEEPSRRKAGEGAFGHRDRVCKGPEVNRKLRGWKGKEAGNVGVGARGTGWEGVRAGGSSITGCILRARGRYRSALHRQGWHWHFLTASFRWHKQSEGQPHPGLGPRDIVTAAPQIKPIPKIGSFRSAFL